MKLNRRDFISTSTCAAASALAGCCTGGTPVARNEHDFMWSVLIHLGMNMWHDHVMTEIKRAGVWAKTPGEEYLDHIRRQYCTADHVRFDEAVWKDVSESYAKNGVNTIMLDVGEALKYPSHPELAVKGSWSPDKLRAEIARLRGMGFEVLPKLNFSSTHDAWLGQYHMMVSTRPYYKVVADVIRDVAEIFDSPRYFHIGYDEEFASMQRNDQIAIVRRGDLWWHDVNYTAKQVLDLGMRPCIWVDHIVTHPEESKVWERLSKDIVISPWYYHSEFNPKKAKMVQATLDLLQKGYDIVPAASTCFFDDDNLERWAEFGKKNLVSPQLKGFMTAPWIETSAYFKNRLIHTGETVARARKIWES